MKSVAGAFQVMTASDFQFGRFCIPLGFPAPGLRIQSEPNVPCSKAQDRLDTHIPGKLVGMLIKHRYVAMAIIYWSFNIVTLLPGA